MGAIKEAASNNADDVISRHDYPLYGQGVKTYCSKRRHFALLVSAFFILDFIWSFDAVLCLPPWIQDWTSSSPKNDTVIPVSAGPGSDSFLWMPSLRQQPGTTDGLGLFLALFSLALHLALCLMAGAVLEFNRRLHLNQEDTSDFEKSPLDVSSYRKTDVATARKATKVFLIQSFLHLSSIPVEMIYLTVRTSGVFYTSHLLVFLKSLAVAVHAIRGAEANRFIKSYFKKSPTRGNMSNHQ